MKHVIAAAFALLAAAPAQDEQVVTGKVPRINDYWPGPGAAAYLDPPRDPAHPARNRPLVIPSGPVRPELGRPAEMNALFFLASGAGPKPTMLLLHGLPGNERNLDLAQAVRRAGWNVLTFTYRGAWGSEGTFSIQHAIADAGAALAFLRSGQAAATYNVDSRRIVLAGHSMGAYAAAATAAADMAQPGRTPIAHPEEGLSPAKPRPGGRPLAGLSPGPHQTATLTGLILLDAWDIARDTEKMLAEGPKGRADLIASFGDIGRSLGPITAEDLANGLARRGRGWDLKALAPGLARLPVLTIYATHGIAADNQAVAEALRTQGARLTARELDTDHSFADKRVALAVEVVRWLDALPRN